MTLESESFVLLNRNLEPLNDDDFFAYMAALGSISPAVMSAPQLVSVIANLLQNYCDEEDVEMLEKLAEAAVDTVVGFGADVALDLAVGPEDGIN